MAFSARFLGSLRRKSFSSASSVGVVPRRMVPFIGRMVTWSASFEKKSSGERERMVSYSFAQ